MSSTRCDICNKKSSTLKSFKRVIVFKGMEATPVTEKVQACAACRKESTSRYEEKRKIITTALTTPSLTKPRDFAKLKTKKARPTNKGATHGTKNKKGK